MSIDHPARPHHRAALLAVALLACLAFTGASCPRKPAVDTHKAYISYDMGTDALKNNDPRMAMSHFEKALEYNPDLPQAHNALGLLFYAQGRYELAVEHYKKAIAALPDFSEAMNNLGVVYLDQKLYDKAIPLFQKALQDYNYREPHIAEGNLGWALYQKGQKEDGIAHLRTALHLQPKYCLGHWRLAEIFQEAGNPSKALDHLKTMAADCGDRPETFFNLGRAYEITGQEADATVAYKKCQSLATEGGGPANAAWGERCEEALKHLGAAEGG